MKTAVRQEALADSFGRTLTTLRVSVTDRCDLRCTYCMPEKAARFVPRPELLGAAELKRLLDLFLMLGVRRFKFTGGEPLLRPDLEEILASVAGRAELSLTTNGTLLAGRAEGLWQTGLRRITVSLDSLNPATYSRLTRGGDLRRVLDGLKEAERLGFSPIKLNAVLVDQTLAEMRELAELTLHKKWEVRFIEYMPVTFGLGGRFWSPASLKAALGPLEDLPRESPASPAAPARLKGARGRLGFINSVSEPFCTACDRLRLQADGFLRLCMARPDGLNLRERLRAGAGNAELAEAITAAAWRKPAGHAFYREPAAADAQMSSIGG